MARLSRTVRKSADWARRVFLISPSKRQVGPICFFEVGWSCGPGYSVDLLPLLLADLAVAPESSFDVCQHFCGIS